MDKKEITCPLCKGRRYSDSGNKEKKRWMVRLNIPMFNIDFRLFRIKHIVNVPGEVISPGDPCPKCQGYGKIEK